MRQHSECLGVVDRERVGDSSELQGLVAIEWSGVEGN